MQTTLAGIGTDCFLPRPEALRARDGMLAVRISLPDEYRGFPPQADPLMEEKKQGQSGSDGPTPREALYSRMRERGNGTDGLESPRPFSNEIRTAMNDDKR